MGFRDDYDFLIENITSSEKVDSLIQAREEFYKLTGRLHGDEKSFEKRLAYFFEWYIFDRKINGRSRLETVIEDSDMIMMEDTRDLYRRFVRNIHSIFRVKKANSRGMKIKDLFTGQVYYLNDLDASLGFYRNAIFEGRLFFNNNEPFLSPATCFHPTETLKVIKLVLKDAWRKGVKDIFPIIHRLSYMNLKWETYRNVKVLDIYKFEEYKRRQYWW